jgi:hypothetical protein
MMIQSRDARVRPHGGPAFAYRLGRADRVRSRGGVVCCCVAATVSLLALCLSTTVLAQEALENDVKAAFLYNFTKFVEWPTSPAQNSEPFRICVVADDEFVRSVDRIIEGETVLGRRLVRTIPQSTQDARACAILYVSRATGERGTRLTSAVRDVPVLTVGDSPRFLEQGGAIGFVVENSRVRFDVSASSIQRAGLKVSSKLLRVARSVDGGTR